MGLDGVRIFYREAGPSTVRFSCCCTVTHLFPHVPASDRCLLALLEKVITGVQFIDGEELQQQAV
jgi:hypothetical protein